MGIPNVPIGELDKVLRSYQLGKVELGTVLQQTLALLAGSDDMSRVVLRASETGVLNVCSARVADIVHVTADQDNYTWFGDYIKTTECLVLAHPDNSGRIWARPDKIATANNAYPCDAGSGIIYSVDNLKNLHILIEDDTEVAIVLYTR